MKVKELIEQLQSCNLEATVIFNDVPIIDGNRNIMEGAMQDVVGLEHGFASNGDSYSASERNIAFALLNVPGYLVPSIRLLGYSDKPTDPNRRLIIINSCGQAQG